MFSVLNKRMVSDRVRCVLDSCVDQSDYSYRCVGDTQYVVTDICAAFKRARQLETLDAACRMVPIRIPKFSSKSDL